MRPSPSRVARLYREAADTQQSQRLQAAVKDFGDAVADASRAFEGWQNKEPADGRDGLLGRLKTKGKVLYDLLDITVEDPRDEAQLKKYLRRAANFRRIVKKLMSAKDWDDLETVVKSLQTKSKSAWNKYYEYSTEVQGLIRTFDYEVEATIDAGGFHLVLYQTGLADWDPATIDRLKWVMGEASDLLKKRGMGSLARGSVFVYPTAKVPGTPGTMAWYRRTDDVMTLAAGSSFFLKKSPKDVLKTVIHELGHRAYYRLIGTRGRRSWEEFFELGKGVPDLNTMIRRWEHFADVDSPKEALRKRHFDNYYFGLKKHHPVEAEWLRIVVISLGLRDNEKYDSYHGFPTKSSKAALDQLIARRGEVRVFMEPVTAYSATSATELFAEVFAHYVVYGPRTISGAVRAAFLQALPMLKSGSRSKKPTRAEEAMISAWKFGHITRAQLEEKLGRSRADEIVPKK